MEMVQGPVIVSGASGMLGGAIKTGIERGGARILQLVRRPAQRPGEVQWFPAAERPLADTAAIEACHAALHLSGASLAGRRWSATYKREIFSSRVESTAALARTLAALKHPPRTLLVASAVGIYGNRGDEILDERSAPGRGFLAELCTAWEAAAEPARKAGIRVVNLRFGVVLGREGALQRMLPIFRLGLGGRLGSGRQWMSWVSLQDLVRAVAFALENERIWGPVNITAPHPLRNEEFTRALARRARRPAVLPVPAFALKVALGEMSEEALLASTRVIPQKLAAAGFEFGHSGIEAALAAALQPPALS